MNPDPDPSWLAARTIEARYPDGRLIRITPRLGQPYQVLLDEWACPVAIDGLHGRIPDIRGIDAWQALQLGQQLLAKLLMDLVLEGCRFFWTESEEEMNITDLFALIPKQN